MKRFRVTIYYSSLQMDSLFTLMELHKFIFAHLNDLKLEVQEIDMNIKGKEISTTIGVPTIEIVGKKIHTSVKGKLNIKDFERIFENICQQSNQNKEEL